MTRVKMLRGLPALTAAAVLAVGLVVAGAGPAAAANGISVNDVSLHQNGSDTDQVVSISGPVVGTSGTLVVKIAMTSGLREEVFQGFNLDPSTNAACTEPVVQITSVEIDCTSSAWGAGDLGLAFVIGGGAEGPVLVTSCSQNPVATTTAEYAGDSGTRATGTAVDVDCTPSTTPPHTTAPPRATSAPTAAKTPASARTRIATATVPAVSSTPPSPVGSSAAAALPVSPTNETSAPTDTIAAAPVAAQQPPSAPHTSLLWPVTGVIALVLAGCAAGGFFFRRHRLATAAENGQGSTESQ